jgi:hypothetical protein|tara:strand:- start:24 stop:551 length:528 start_codon:yes stop_codon:yes gene_type:complete
MDDKDLEKYKTQLKSYKKAVNAMDVSYGVDREQQEEAVGEVEISKAVEPKKSKGLVEELEEMKANGLTDTDEFRKKQTRLEEILGVDTINPFGTNELDIFEEKLGHMTFSDMQSLAQRVGLNPYHSESKLKKTLIKEFKFKNRNNSRNILPSSPKPVFDPQNPKHAELLKKLGDL